MLLIAYVYSYQTNAHDLHPCPDQNDDRKVLDVKSLRSQCS
jgi:hypothetical protein